MQKLIGKTGKDRSVDVLRAIGFGFSLLAVSPCERFFIVPQRLRALRERNGCWMFFGSGFAGLRPQKSPAFPHRFPAIDWVHAIAK